MPLMDWNEELSVGVQEMDDDHKKLIGLLNEMHDDLLAGKSKQKLEELLDRIVVAAQDHFAREERLLAETAYSDADAHLKEHDELIEIALDLQRRFKNGSAATLSMKALDLAQSLLAEHFQGSDKKYTAHLNAAKIL